MNKKNGSIQKDIDNMKRQNQHLKQQGDSSLTAFTMFTFQFIDTRQLQLLHEKKHKFVPSPQRFIPSLLVHAKN